MNAFRPAAPAPSLARALPAGAASHRAPRERDFGTGYGRSSGYASARRYTQDWTTPRFRCS